MTPRPRASSSCTRKGRASTIRALACASLVMIPDWEPVKLTAGTCRSFRAMARRAMAMRSPAESSMSSSRRDGFGLTSRARARRSVRGVAHRGDHHHDVLAGGSGAGHLVGHLADAIGVRHGRAAVFLDDHAQVGPLKGLYAVPRSLRYDARRSHPI